MILKKLSSVCHQVLLRIIMMQRYSGLDLGALESSLRLLSLATEVGQALSQVLVAIPRQRKKTVDTERFI